jgi:arylsulfatase A-like enzyme
VSVEEGPKDRGWTELLVSGNKPQEHGPSWEHFRTVSQAPDPQRRGEGQILRPGWGHYTLYGTAPQGNKHDEKVLGEALAALPRAAAGKQPWAMFVGMTGPHDPYMVPRKFLDLYDLKDIPLPESYCDDLSDKPRVYKRIRDTRFGQLTDREVREAIRHFRAYCSYLDHLFGELLAALDKTGQAQDTLVLYCSDHGDYCGEHGLFAKGIPCFRGAYHVPAIIRWPAGVDCPGRRVDSLVSLADFAPTFVEVAGGRPDPQLTGQSLVPFLTGPTAPIGWREEIHTQCNGVELYYTQRSVMTKDFKYVYNGFDNDELYTLCRDEHEMTNLAGDANFDLIKRDLIRRMWRFARQEQDAAINSYITVGLAPFGPGEAFKEA